MSRIEVITSVERRRRWSAAEKARLVAAMDEPGAVVTEIARGAGVDVSLLYRWRRRGGGAPRQVGRGGDDGEAGVGESAGNLGLWGDSELDRDFGNWALES